MYQIAVCDDEEAIRAQIVRALSTHPRQGEFVVSEFSSGENLLDNLRAGKTFFLLILDIELQSQNGVTVGKLLREELRDNSTQVLYISAHSKYAMELFDVRPLNFLMKPLDEGKLSACVTQALELAPKLDATLTVFSGKQAQRIPLREIRYVESYNKRLTIHTTQGDYMEKVNALPEAMTDFSNDMAEIMSTMSSAASQEDLDALLAPLEELRAYEQPYYDFAAIDNPPEKYAEAHERLANACTQMGDVLDEYIDFMKGALEGTSNEEDGQAVADKMTEAADEMAQAGKALTSIE